jgi:hypothetical protein
MRIVTPILLRSTTVRGNVCGGVDIVFIPAPLLDFVTASRGDVFHNATIISGEGDLPTRCDFNMIVVSVEFVRCCEETMVTSCLLLLDCGEWQPWPPPMQFQITEVTAQDCFGRPVAPHAWVDVVELYSNDSNKTLHRTSKMTKCLNLGSHNYLGFVAADESCTPLVIESL